MRPLLSGERIVVYPYTQMVGAWAYAVPRGELVRLKDGCATVKLDDGNIRETDVRNVRRAAGWKPPKPSRAKPLFRKAHPLVDGWEDVPLPGMGES